jgi:hypothetical protein
MIVSLPSNIIFFLVDFAALWFSGYAHRFLPLDHSAAKSTRKKILSEGDETIIYLVSNAGG